MSESGNLSALVKAQELVSELYRFRDHYIEKNGIEKAGSKNKDVSVHLENVLEELNGIQGKCLENSRAQYFYLRGKAINVTPVFEEGALENLSKAVKLDPKLIEAWNQLGECYWKKGDVAASKNCFVNALKHEQNKVSLRQLSMVLRQVGRDREEKLKNIEESVQKAREAVQLDVADGISWCVLGNAYLTLFFFTNQNPSLLKQSMLAYHQAEKDSVAKNSADFHFNRATVYKYEEEYQQSLEGYCQAEALDPSWSEPQKKVQDLIVYLERIQDLISKKGCLRGKKLKTLVQSLTPAQLGPYSGGSYTSSQGKTIKLELVPFSELVPGINVYKVVLGKVVCSVITEDPVPFTFCLIDKEETCWSVTVYNLAPGKGVIIGDTVAIPEPYVQDVNISFKDKVVNYRSIRVETPVVLVVNGKKLGVDKQAMAEIAVSILTS